MIKVKFNDNWKYADFGKCKDIFDSEPDFHDIKLPHDAMRDNERTEDNINGNTTGFCSGGSYVYIKKYYVDSKLKGKYIKLEFEGVYMNAMVYVNGTFAGKCPNGYVNFYVDITNFLNYDEENEIKFVVKTDMELCSRWYSGSGIYRDVNILIGNPLRIKEDGVKITTSSVSKEGSIINISTDIRYDGIGYTEATAKINIMDRYDNVVISEVYPFSIYGNTETTLRNRLFLEDCHLWDLDNPYLYKIEVDIIKDDESLDKHIDTFGIRKIEVDSKNGFRINGQSINLRGGCIHHDNGVLGSASFYDAEKRRISLMKKAGFNAVRMAHNPCSKHLLKVCDEEGILILEEIFDVWNHSKADHDSSLFFEEWWKYDIDAIVNKNYNHPSVFMYNIGNEIQDIGTGHGSIKNREIAEYLRKLDNTRFVGNAINGMFAAMGKMDLILKDIIKQEDDDKPKAAGDVNDFMTILDKFMPEIISHDIVSESIEKSCFGVDICGYNYMDSRYMIDGKKYPNRVIVGSETRPNAIANNWSMVKKLPYLIGDFVWCGWDYIGESGVGKVDYNFEKSKGIYGPFPWYLANVGDFDICGNRRPQSYYREIVWGLRNDPYIAVINPKYYECKAAVTNWSWSDSINSWTWHGYEDKPIEIEVYSNADEVELYINGKSIDKKIVGEEKPYMAIFKTIYKEGEIVAKSYKDGILTGECKLKSSKKATKFLVEISKYSLSYKEDELSYLNISIVDDHEICDTFNEHKVKVQVHGGGDLIGFGSSDPKSLEYFNEAERTTYNGKVLAIIRRNISNEDIVVNIASNNIDEMNIVLEGKK